METCVKSVLFSGKSELTKSFLFEAAIHWAEEGHRVIYIAPEKLQSLPSIYHDRSRSSLDVFKQMRLMYLSNYETLIEQLVDLHTFAAVPSVLLIDNLDHYIFDEGVKDSLQMHIARICTVFLHSMNTCAKVLKRNRVIFCASVTSEVEQHIYKIYFDNIWRLYDENQDFCLKKYDDRSNEIYKYRKLKDNAVILKEIVKIVTE